MRRSTWGVLSMAVILVGAAATAGANPAINLYITQDQSLSDAIFDRTERDFLPFFDPTANTPLIDPVYCTGGQPTSETFFVWGQFAGDFVPYSRIFALNLAVSTADDGHGNDLALGDNAMYRHARITGPPTTHWSRWWQGSGPRTINDIVQGWSWSTDGIQYWLNGDGSYDLYNEVDGSFLLGAFEVNGSIGEVRLSVDELNGIFAWTAGYHDAYTPDVYVNGTLVQEYNPDGSVLPTVLGSEVVATFVPEPASLLLLLCVAVTRRRR
jgi:hypothetical protein